MAAYLATAAAIYGLRMMLDTSGSREKTNKSLESKIEKAFQDFKNKMKALQEDFKKLQSRVSRHFLSSGVVNPGSFAINFDCGEGGQQDFDSLACRGSLSHHSTQTQFPGMCRCVQSYGSG
ncbi:hypothetical protein DV515_00016022 [Chloebia gouldiae]|uniref:Uncharacterized protein n=1 Tax=Chloebia gouldiae TaxID=44316 RepID=A0A3L8RU42_CHLGU|nr:hypothetical protein DV515_00016022 [Chloebia gouldiae]